MSAKLALCALFILAGCAGGTARDDGRLSVVATTGQVADLARQVGGEHVRVTALMGPGIDPHLYKASAGDVDRLRLADLIVYNGLHLEARMGDVLAGLSSRKPTLAVAEAIPVDRLLSSPDYADAHDPHVWFDVRLWRLGIEPLAARLSELDPANAEAYRARAAAYAKELDLLDAELRATFATIPDGQRVLVTAHDAFGYFGRAYGFDVRGLQGISTATEAGTADMQNLAAFIAERRIPAIFVETSVSTRALEAVREAVRARGFDVRLGGAIYSDALGDTDTPAGTYAGMVRHNAATITAALREGSGRE